MLVSSKVNHLVYSDNLNHLGLKCDVGGKCALCSKYSLQPDKDECRGGCPPGSSYRREDAQGECLYCSDRTRCNSNHRNLIFIIFLGKKCSPYDKCQECVDPSHKLMSEEYKERLPSTVALLGKLACLSPSEVPDYFYVDRNQFKPCREGCKRCTNGHDCQECGSYKNPSASSYLVTPTNINAPCLQSCPLDEYRYVVPAKVLKCLTCSANTYYVEGSYPPMCDSCTSGAYWIESKTRICKPCSFGCGSCASDVICNQCKDPNNYIQTSGGSCDTECLEREMKISGSPKRCQVCPPNCQACSETQGCIKCDPNYGLIDKKCIPCEENCFNCNNRGCLVCDPNYSLEKHECKAAHLVDYKMVQFYDPKSPYTFNLRFILNDEPQVSQRTYEEFQKSILNHQDKLKIEIPSLEGGINYTVTKANDNPNKYTIRVKPQNISSLSVKDKLIMNITTFSKSLDPLRTGLPYLYTLLQRSQELEVEVYKLKEKNLDHKVESIAEITRVTNEVSSSASLGLGIFFAIFSIDQEGIILQFNQFLSLVRRVKLIGMFFGSSLEEFIEIVCGGTRRQEVIEIQGSTTKNERRILEMTDQKKQNLRIRQESEGSHKKLDAFNETIFLEGAFMMRSVAYSISWVLKLIGLYFLSELKQSTNKIVTWKLVFLKYQRKVHQAVFMTSAMDIFFYGTRVLVHRRWNVTGVLTKIYCGVNITLLLLDILEIASRALRLRYMLDWAELVKFQKSKIEEKGSVREEGLQRGGKKDASRGQQEEEPTGNRKRFRFLDYRRHFGSFFSVGRRRRIHIQSNPKQTAKNILQSKESSESAASQLSGKIANFFFASSRQCW